MRLIVEPRDGPELDRLITALLNATGIVSHVIGAAEARPGVGGVAVIDLAAEHLRGALVVLAEHRGDEELALLTQLLAEATMIVGADLGLGGCFAGDDLA